MWSFQMESDKPNFPLRGKLLFIYLLIYLFIYLFMYLIFILYSNYCVTAVMTKEGLIAEWSTTPLYSECKKFLSSEWNSSLFFL